MVAGYLCNTECMHIASGSYYRMGTCYDWVQTKNKLMYYKVISDNK